ncbi:hypothetical protein BC936DRAFT_146955 [Jimgerdemannia flammicorona]|uniref:Uncharacterized protein n=1 Tax=Jimgerdemannia flammicorona TaxID=994334 RepID=A0A433D6I3_9FUNG|nr:hypothetical protein BC936DRAFT_146955 [Jimgerdemannia flammicorona]
MRKTPCQGRKELKHFEHATTSTHYKDEGLSPAALRLGRRLWDGIYSIEKAVMFIGLETENVVKVKVDGEGTMHVDKLGELVMEFFFFVGIATICGAVVSGVQNTSSLDWYSI